MIWTLKKQNYLVTLPDLPMLEKDFCFTKPDPFLCSSWEENKLFVAAKTNHKKLSTRLLDRTTDSQFITNVYPVLVPLDEHNWPIFNIPGIRCLEKTVFKMGFLFDRDTKEYPLLNDPTHNPLGTSLTLRDKGPGNPIEWVFCEGCLVTRDPIFCDTLERIDKIIWSSWR